MNPSELPGEVREAIDKYYAAPIKTANNGKLHHIDLSSLRSRNLATRCEFLGIIPRVPIHSAGLPPSGRAATPSGSRASRNFVSRLQCAVNPL